MGTLDSYPTIIPDVPFKLHSEMTELSKTVLCNDSKYHPKRNMHNSEGHICKRMIIEFVIIFIYRMIHI